MLLREEIFRFAKEMYGTGPDYPWQRTPRYAILRHQNSRKWYAALIDIPKENLPAKAGKGKSTRFYFRKR